MKRSISVLTSVGLSLVVGACSVSAGVPASPSPLPTNVPPQATASPRPSPTTVPASPSTPASPSPAAPSDPAATPTASPNGTITLRAYFFLGGEVGSAGLVPVLRDLPETPATGTAAMRALLAGPNAKERGASPAISTTIPDGTRLLGLSIDDGVATVDLSSEFESGGGTASCLGRLGQVVYTLTQFKSVDSVAFRVDGQPVSVFGCEGIVLDGPVGRDTDSFGETMFEAILPAIFVERPAWGAALGHPGSVTGTANVFEAQFRFTLLDGRGRTLIDEPVHAACGTGCRGAFDVFGDSPLAHSAPKPEWGTIRVWDVSERDGTPVLVREYPVWLTPEEHEPCGC